MQQELTFVFERETKNCYRFQEQSPAPVVGTLYVQKFAFLGAEVPKEGSVIRVVIQAPVAV